MRVKIPPTTYFDLFAGCGGFSLGLKQAGFKCLAAIDNWPAAIVSYWRNLCLSGWSTLRVDPSDESAVKDLEKKMGGNPQTYNRLFNIPSDGWLHDEKPMPTFSLWQFDVDKLPPQSVMEWLGIQPGELGAIVGGPPCQGFSKSNVHRKLDDPRNTGPFTFLKWCEVVQPRFFIMENVPGMLTLGREKGEKWGPFPKWVQDAGKAAGYHVTINQLNAANYGVPQRRKRVFYYGVRMDLHHPPEFDLFHQGLTISPPKPTHTWDYFGDHEKQDTSGQPFVTVMEAIGELSENHPLAATQDSYAKDLPLGDPGRFPNGDAKDLPPPVRFMGHLLVADRFMQIMVPARPAQIDNQLQAGDNSVHYMNCPHCGKYNLKVRNRCHSIDCGKLLHTVLFDLKGEAL